MAVASLVTTQRSGLARCFSQILSTRRRIQDKNHSLMNTQFLTTINAYIFAVLSLRPNAGHNLLIDEDSDHTQRHNTLGRTPLD